MATRSEQDVHRAQGTQIAQVVMRCQPRQHHAREASQDEGGSARETREPARLQIVGQGTLVKSGLPFLLISSSSDPARVHVVAYAYEGAYVGARIHCDCTAAQYGRRGRHVPIVASWLEAGLSALGASPSPGPAHPGDTALLHRNNRPFSLMK